MGAAFEMVMGDARKDLSKLIEQAPSTIEGLQKISEINVDEYFDNIAANAATKDDPEKYLTDMVQGIKALGNAMFSVTMLCIVIPAVGKKPNG